MAEFKGKVRVTGLNNTQEVHVTAQNSLAARKLLERQYGDKNVVDVRSA
jgi:hypothetical protein